MSASAIGFGLSLTKPTAEMHRSELMLTSDQETAILVSDNDDINRVVMGLQLEECNVVKWTNGLDALITIQESKPDFILLDPITLSLKGYKACQKIDKRTAK